MKAVLDALVTLDPLGSPHLLMVRSLSKEGRWHRVTWREMLVAPADRFVDFEAECDSGFCERALMKPSDECRHETAVLAYLRGESSGREVEQQLMLSLQRLGIAPFEDFEEVECPECRCFPCDCEGAEARVESRRLYELDHTEYEGVA